ncbi:MAG TPA: YkgJ family cysteine cluster protein [Tepidisphaeraceae bacterium]
MSSSGCLCDKCSALCCRYFVLEIDKPETRGQFDDVRWYLVHEGTFVFIEKKKWYLGVYARCKHLQEDNRCGIYDKRPNICRAYSTESCDYHGGDYGWEKLFSSAEQLERYAREKLAKRRQKARAKGRKAGGGGRRTGVRRRQRRANLLPILLTAGGRGPINGSIYPSPGANGNRNGNGNGNGHAHGAGNGRAISLPLLSR